MRTWLAACVASLALGACGAGSQGAPAPRSTPVESARPQHTTAALPESPPASPAESEPQERDLRPDDPSVFVQVDVTVGEDGSVSVLHRLPLAWVGRELENVCLTFAQAADAPERDGAPSGYEPCHASVSDDLSTSFAWHATTGAEAADGLAPRRQARGVFSTGRALVPLIRYGAGPDSHLVDMAVEVTVHLPEGWSAVASGAQTGQVVRFASIAEARDAVFEWGRLAQSDVTLGDATVQFVSADYSERELLPFAQLASRASAAATELLGRTPTGRLVVRFDRRAVGFDQHVFDGALSVVGDRPPTGEVASPAGRALLTAMTRLWLRSDVPWLGDGLAAYVAWRVAARVDSAPLAVSMDRLMERYRRYRTAAGVRRADHSDASMGSWSADAGVVIAFCADAELHGLDRDLLRDVLAPALERVEPDGRLGVEGYVGALEAASTDVARRTQMRLRRRGAIDFGPCLAASGYRLQAVVYRDLTQEGRDALLRASGNLEEPPTVGRPRASSGFEAGDRLLSVDGRPLGSLLELGWVLRGAALGDRLRFHVWREGRRRAVVQRSPNLDDFAQERVRFRAEPSPDRAAAARWIRGQRGRSRAASAGR